MKKHFAILFLCASALFAYNLIQSPSNTRETEREQVSGAFEALNFMGDRQTYPNVTLPSNSYFAAWQKWNSNKVTSRDNVTPPWETIGPHNRGGRTLAIVLNPQNTNTMYAGSASGGLWKSTTGGAGVEAWERLELGYPVLGVSTIAIHPTDSMVMYIGTGEVYNVEAAGTGAAYRNTRGSYGMGILKTTDGGQTWTKSLDWSYDQQHGIWMIKIDPTNPNTVFAATTQGIYKSTDAGASWIPVLDVVMGTDLLIHPENPNIVVAACGNFGSEGFGIYKSIDAGESWQQITSNLPEFFLGKIQLGMAPSNPDIIYASVGNGFSFSDGASWLCRSNDFGSNWTIQSTEDYSRWQGWFSHDVAVSPTNPNRLIAIGINVWGSANGGNSLNILTEGGVGFANPPIEGPDGNPLYVHSDAHDVIYHPSDPNKVYVASDGGIHRSDDGGITWYSANGGYQTAQFYNGASTSQNSTDFFIGGLQDNGTIKWNGDLTWTRVLGGDGSWTAVHPNTDNIFFSSSQRLNIAKTINGGNSFFGLSLEESYVDPVAFIAPYVIAPSNALVLYAGTSVMARSNDQGENWETLNNGIQLDGNPILSMEVSSTDEDVVYAGTAPFEGNRGHLFVTQDGNTFTDITSDLPDRFPMDITVDPTDPAIAYVVFSGFGTGHVYKTQDFGVTWEDISGNLPDVPTNAVIVDPLILDHVYVGNDLGVFVSTAGGTVWEDYQDGLPNATMIFDLKISNSNRKLRVATHGNGAFERDLIDETTDVEATEAEAFGFRLFPNPTADIVQIAIEKGGLQNVVVNLLDTNGKKLKSTSIIPQSNTITIDCSDLPAGTYFVSLQSANGQWVKPLVKQ